MTYTNEQLKQSLAKMLPEKVRESDSTPGCLKWRDNPLYPSNVVRDTELLHLVQLARKSKGVTSLLSCDSTWQEQVIELLAKSTPPTPNSPTS
jgi:hypothetical protein